MDMRSSLESRIENKIATSNCFSTSCSQKEDIDLEKIIQNATKWPFYLPFSPPAQEQVVWYQKRKTFLQRRLSNVGLKTGWDINWALWPSAGSINGEIFEIPAQGSRRVAGQVVNWWCALSLQCYWIKKMSPEVPLFVLSENTPYWFK